MLKLFVLVFWFSIQSSRSGSCKQPSQEISKCPIALIFKDIKSRRKPRKSVFLDGEITFEKNEECTLSLFTR